MVIFDNFDISKFLLNDQQHTKYHHYQNNRYHLYESNFHYQLFLSLHLDYYDNPEKQINLLVFICNNDYKIFTIKMNFDLIQISPLTLGPTFS